MNDSSAQSSLIWRRAGRPGAEKWSAAAFVVAALACSATSCQTRDRDPATTTIEPAYAADIDALCNAIARSGADKLAPGDQTVTVAMWLGANLKTADARAFLVRTQPLVGNAKADALDAERARAGLTTCPLAAVWRESEAGSGSAR
jgi:hypothetical protein